MIEVEDLTCRFGDFEAVKGISFRVAPGGIFAFCDRRVAALVSTGLSRRAQRAPRIEKLLKQVEPWDKRDQVSMIFSGCMKRRLEIVRGFLHTHQGDGTM